MSGIISPFTPTLVLETTEATIVNVEAHRAGNSIDSAGPRGNHFLQTVERLQTTARLFRKIANCDLHSVVFTTVKASAPARAASGTVSEMGWLRCASERGLRI